MLRQLGIGLILGGLSFSVLAQVIIKVPEEIVVLAIDDQELKQSLFSGNDKIYRLDSGQHRIALQYKQLFNPSYITHDIVKSGVVTLDTGHLSDGQYDLVLIDAPKDLDSAKKFAEQPTLALKNQTGQTVAQQTGAGSQAKSWLAGGIFTSVFDVRTEKNAAVQNPELKPVTTAIPSPSHQGQQSKDIQLIELWKNATAQERQRFTAWLAEQAAK